MIGDYFRFGIAAQKVFFSVIVQKQSRIAMKKFHQMGQDGFKKFGLEFVFIGGLQNII
jgi:hypothetical protein